MHTLTLILIGLGLGLGAAVPIGPVNVEIARRTLARGRMAGMALGFGAVTVDVLFAVATSLGLSRLVTKDMLTGRLGLIGVGICFLLASFSLIAAYRAWKYGVTLPGDQGAADKQANNATTLAGDYAVGFGMTALNLYTWIWWCVTVPALAAQRLGEGGTESVTDLPITCLGIAIAAGGWVIGFTTVINSLRQFAGRAWHIGADLGGGLLLLGFGFWALWRLL